MTMISREFQVFAKPVGSNCNLNCQYCYYREKKSLYPETDHFLMTDDILEEYIKQHIQASTEDVINFSWHGGEPLLAGIDFYRKALRLQSTYKPAGKTILNGIQTNGILINEEWCRFIEKEGFIIGISIDGPAEFHNTFRRTKDGNNTWLQVIRGYQLLKQHGVSPEILCVVNSENVRHPLVIYNFLKQMGAKHITFLPLVEPDDGSSGGASSNSVPSEEFGFFLSDVFDNWVEYDIGEIKIQIESQRQIKFGKAKSGTLPKYCIECEVRTMCNGGCPKNRFILTPDGDAGLNYLCKGYKYFFNHCRPFVEAIADAWKNQSDFLPHPPVPFSQERRG